MRIPERQWTTLSPLLQAASKVRLGPGSTSTCGSRATSSPTWSRDSWSGVRWRLTWRAVGDGSYTHQSVVAFGSPAFVLGSMAGSALGNSARRRAAANDAQPRWVVDGSGEITVTTRKVYFGHPQCPLDLAWGGLDTIDLVAPEVFQTSFRNINNGRQTTVRLRTPWASLLFVLAAVTAFPAHPRLLGRGWLPPDFEKRCADIGRPYRSTARLLLNRGH